MVLYIKINFLNGLFKDLVKIIRRIQLQGTRIKKKELKNSAQSSLEYHSLWITLYGRKRVKV